MITATPTFNHWKGGVVTDFLWVSEDSSMSLYDASSQESSFLIPRSRGKVLLCRGDCSSCGGRG